MFHSPAHDKQYMKLKTGNVRAIGEVEEPPKKSSEEPKDNGQSPPEDADPEEVGAVPEFKNKTEVKQAKAKVLASYLNSRGVSTANLNREGLIEKVLEVLEI